VLYKKKREEKKCWFFAFVIEPSEIHLRFTLQVMRMAKTSPSRYESAYSFGQALNSMRRWRDDGDTRKIDGAGEIKVAKGRRREAWLARHRAALTCV